MDLLITGSNGFIGKNLTVKLRELGINYKVYNRENSLEELSSFINNVDYIVHLAGENRPSDLNEFDKVNFGLTNKIANLLEQTNNKASIIFASSIQAELDNDYGRSKLKAENRLQLLREKNGNKVFIYRLPGVFGKWCKPDYNSVVATFCFNVSHNMQIKIENPLAELNLIYIDDLVEEFLNLITLGKQNNKILKVNPEYKVNLNQLANQIQKFKDSRSSLTSERVGDGFVKKLYSTYVSYLSPEEFSYPIASHVDNRGTFAEILKTKDSGQFSFFTAKPGIKRGGHYHHSKTEKFIVVKGEAEFSFKNIITGEKHYLSINSNDLMVVETVPGWFHDIKNTGPEELIVFLWANEVFNPSETDTYNADFLE